MASGLYHTCERERYHCVSVNDKLNTEGYRTESTTNFPSGAENDHGKNRRKTRSREGARDRPHRQALTPLPGCVGAPLTARRSSCQFVIIVMCPTSVSYIIRHRVIDFIVTCVLDSTAYPVHKYRP